jgi:hypothetical protein
VHTFYNMFVKDVYTNKKRGMCGTVSLSKRHVTADIFNFRVKEM